MKAPYGMLIIGFRDGAEIFLPIAPAAIRRSSAVGSNPLELLVLDPIPRHCPGPGPGPLCLPPSLLLLLLLLLLSPILNAGFPLIVEVVAEAVSVDVSVRSGSGVGAMGVDVPMVEDGGMLFESPSSFLSPELGSGIFTPLLGVGDDWD